jgi:pyruvate/2-oxoacid:ferredoxin oxidoreductase beta subunit
MAEARMNLQISQDEFVSGGNMGCPGCGAVLGMRHVLKVMGKRTIVVMPACCWSIITGPFPSTCMKVPLLHVPFETAAACAAGVRQALNRQGQEDVTVMAWAGDGGTFDIGIQAISCTAERNEDIIYVCYDNEAYMNTGIQRSSATPEGAWTTTTPQGERIFKKDIFEIIRAHRPSYVATAVVTHAKDFQMKFEKAKSLKGFRFIHLLSACPTGWRIPADASVQAVWQAVESGVFPLKEADSDGKVRLTYHPERLIPVAEYFKSQGRFKGMPDSDLELFQEYVNQRMRKLGYSEGDTKRSDSDLPVRKFMAA